MKACYNLQTCSEYSDLERDLTICAETGFRFIEIDLVKAEEFLKNHSPEQIGELLEEKGLECAAINAIFDISFCTPEKWESLCERLDYAGRIGKACGAKQVIVLSSERETLPDTITEQEIFADTTEILKRIADRMKTYGMKTAFEPVGTMAVGDVKTAWEIVKAVNMPEVGIVLDAFNLYLWDLCSDIEVIREIDPEKICIVHINDAENIPFRRLNQMHRCMPGDGRIDLQQYMECIRATGYDGLVSVEVLNPSIWKKGPEEVIPEAYEKTGRFIKTA